MVAKKLRKKKTKGRTKLLFVCMCNINRSVTFFNYFRKFHPSFQVKSAGVYTSGAYGTGLSKKLLDWADKIFVMDLGQALFIHKRFPDSFDKVEVIGVSDQYNENDIDLIELIDFWIKTYGSDLF